MRISRKLVITSLFGAVALIVFFKVQEPYNDYSVNETVFYKKKVLRDFSWINLNGVSGVSPQRSIVYMLSFWLI